jgi:hypothetical protein
MSFQPLYCVISAKNRTTLAPEKNIFSPAWFFAPSETLRGAFLRVFPRRKAFCAWRGAAYYNGISIPWCFCSAF